MDIKEGDPDWGNAAELATSASTIVEEITDVLKKPIDKKIEAKTVTKQADEDIVVEINKENREEAKRRYSLPDRAVFNCIDDFLKANIECDFVINATMDEAHYETTMKLIAAGYDILLEKPVTNNKKELLDIQRAANEKGIKIVVCHVLRYAPFYRTIKETINEGVIGKILTMIFV